MKKSIGKAINLKDLEKQIDDFDLKRNDVTNITIDTSYLRDILKNKYKNTSMNISNMSQIKNHLDKTELAGFSKLGQMNLNVRPQAMTRINQNNVIRKTMKEKEEDSLNIYQSFGNSNNDGIRRISNKKVFGFPGKKSKQIPQIFRKEPYRDSHDSFNEFTKFQVLKEDNDSGSSLNSRDFDSFDLERENNLMKNKDDILETANVFESKKEHLKLKRMNTFQNSYKQNYYPNQNTIRDKRSSGFQPYIKIPAPDIFNSENSKKEEFEGFRVSKRNEDVNTNLNKNNQIPKSGSMKIKFTKKSSNINSKNLDLHQKKDYLIQQNNEDSEYEKVNIYQDSIYQENINNYLKKSLKKGSIQAIIQKKESINDINPMKPDTNEDLYSKEIIEY